MAVTATLRAVATTFRIESDHAPLVAWLEDAFCAAVDATTTQAATERAPQHEFVLMTPEGDECSPWTVSLDGAVSASDLRPDAVIGRLVWEINRLATGGNEHVLLHAAVAEIGGSGVVLCATQESGKSTSVAGLVSRGAGYLSDEVAAIDLEEPLIYAYPKPVTLDPGSWDVLPQWRPTMPPGYEELVASVWYTPASRAVSSVTPRVLALPRYDPTRASELTPCSRAETLVAIATECFNLERLGRVAFSRLAELVESVDCYRWSIRTLDEACPLLESAVPHAAFKAAR